MSHENFSEHLYEQDIALLHLDQDLVFSPSLLPVCLPPPGPNTYHGQLAILTGWGRHWDSGPLAPSLEHVHLSILSNKQCMEWYGRAGYPQHIPEDTFLCAGFEEGGRDACSGDSGGPLVVYRADLRAELVGVVSWGLGCGEARRPGVYTRVSSFLPWIEGVVGRGQLYVEERWRGTDV